MRADFESHDIPAFGLARDDSWPTDITHILSSVAPPRSGDEGLPDPILNACADKIKSLNDLMWMGYLSSTNVYGDRKGGWVDESTEPAPSLNRGARRLNAEDAWRALSAEIVVPVHLFRLAGIYGPGRSALDTVKAGRARRVIKEGQVFSRIHVDDIAAMVVAAAISGLPTGVFNGADQMPAPPQDVIAFAADLLGLDAPPEVAFEDADLSPMAKSFYAESKRVKATRLEELGVRFQYPTYRDGLKALL